MRRESTSRLGLICLSVLLLLPVIALAHVIDRTPPADIDELQQRVAGVLESHGVPGAGLALFNRNKVLWSGGVGTTAWNGGAPVTADTRFRAGSVTKSLVAAAIMQQVEAGKLDLTARVKDIAPEVDIRNPWHNANPVLLVHLLEHSAGFDDMHFKNSYNLNEDPNMPLLAAVNHGFESLQVRWRPGSRMSYSNPGYGVAGYLLEKAVQQPFESYIDQALLTPLDMPRSTLLFNGGRLENLAEGYDAAYGEPVKHHGLYLRPAGNLVTTPLELAHFGRMLLNKGVFNGKRILDAASVARMQHPESTQAAQAGLDYGYGLGIHAQIMDGILLYGHSGGINGFLSYYAYSPKHNFGFVVLLNASHSGMAMREIARIMLAYLAADAVPEYPAVANIEKTQLLNYVGYYRDASPRNELMHFMTWLLNVAEVRAVDGKLVLAPLFGQADTLVPVGDGLFRPQNAPLATIVVLNKTNASNRPVIVANGSYLKPASWFSTHIPLYLMVIAGLLMLSVLVFTPIWLTRLLLGRLKGVKHLSVRWAPLAAVLCFILSAVALLGVDLVTLARINVHTLSITVFSILFALFSLGALVLAIRAFWLPVHAGVRLHSLMASLACVWVSSYLLYWGIIGARLWAW